MKMAKTKIPRIDLPKRLLGLKLSNGTRKDLRKLLKKLEDPEIRAMALSAVGVAASFLAEKAGEREVARIKPKRKVPAAVVQPN
jgi:hypothetical protein